MRRAKLIAFHREFPIPVRFLRNALDALPDSAEVQEFGHDFLRDETYMKVSHKSFKPVPEGEYLPICRWMCEDGNYYLQD